MIVSNMTLGKILRGLMKRFESVELDPVAQLERLPIDDLIEQEDWDLCPRPEEAFLDVPEGTVASLLRKIGEQQLWPSLYQAAKRHPDAWMSILYDFMPREQAFVEPLVSFLMMSRIEDHTAVVFAQDADEWAWSENTAHLLPTVIERISQIRERNSSGLFQPVVPTLDRVIKRLSDLAMELKGPGSN